MTAYFIRRLLLMIPTLLGITFLVFTITRFVPGGPIEQIIVKAQQGGLGEAGAPGVRTSIAIPESILEGLKKHYHLDKPIWQAYVLWLGDVLTLDFGKSYKYNIPVLDVITERFPVSIYFGLIGFSLAYLVSIPLGVAKALSLIHI